MFKRFWEDLTWDMKRIYTSGLVDSVPAERKQENSRRNETLVYYLKKGTEKMRVCKNIFLATLGVNEWTVREYSKKKPLEWILQMRINAWRSEKEKRILKAKGNIK